jgi:hypothetical protein
MANKKLKCKHCCDYFPREGMIRAPAGNFHSAECVYTWSQEKQRKEREKAYKKLKRERHEAAKKKTRNRSWYYRNLQALINQYVVHVRDKDKPCYTCGSASAAQYHAGHRYHAGRGGADPRRFMLENLHKQCVHCNNYNGGRPVEYDAALASEYGQEFVEHLSCKVNFNPLKEQYPTFEDIEADIEKYRKLLRDNGLTPRA